MFLENSHGFPPRSESEQRHRGLLHGEDEAVVDVQRTSHRAIGPVAWAARQLCRAEDGVETQWFMADIFRNSQETLEKHGE